MANTHEDIHDLKLAYNFLHASLAVGNPLSKDDFIKSAIGHLERVGNDLGVVLLIEEQK